MRSHELQAIGHELKFWTGFVRSERFINEWLPEIQPGDLQLPARKILSTILKPDSEVLDVGSGVVSLLRGTVPASHLTTADPLGCLYECIFDYAAHGIKPPVTITGEELGDTYEDHFDVVHMSNALDHSQNPVTTYENLLKAVKPGGYVVVQGFENEGTFENWQGFHQWDIHINKHLQLFIGNRQGGGVGFGKGRIHAETFKLSTGKRWFLWVSQK